MPCDTAPPARQAPPPAAPSYPQSSQAGQAALGPAAGGTLDAVPPGCDELAARVLARKIAALAPHLPAAEQARLTRATWDNLVVQVQDQAERVRVIIAQLVQRMAQAPRSLILQLARDASFSVSDPVLRLSPLLTEDDLLELLDDGRAHTAASIAARPDLGERVCDVIARNASTAAVRCLLQNPLAAIREATLDLLVAQASEHADWHEPLAARPGLSARNARILAGFVSDQLIRLLASRPELDPSLVRELEDSLSRRVAEERRGPRGGPKAGPLQWLADARTLSQAGELNDAAVLSAIRGGQTQQVSILLAVAAAVPPEAVQRVAKLRAVKAIVSLAWKGGLSMATAGPLQALLCEMSPSATLQPRDDGGFPLTEEEMSWQVSFVTRSTA